VEVEYHSFELAPETPDEVPEGHAEHLTRRMGVSLDQARDMEARTIMAAREVGLDIDYAILQQSNTRKAHQLLHYAKARGKQSAMKERLMIAYFTEGRSMARVSDLADLAADVGLDREDVVRSLESGAHLDEVALDKQQATAYGVTAVPFFVFDGKYALVGAQQPTTFGDVLKQAYAENAPAA
jgi:predicted DsbA family dithiol-disulfide isomerase